MDKRKLFMRLAILCLVLFGLLAVYDGATGPKKIEGYWRLLPGYNMTEAEEEVADSIARVEHKKKVAAGLAEKGPWLMPIARQRRKVWTTETTYSYRVTVRAKEHLFLYAALGISAAVLFIFASSMKPETKKG